MTTQHTHHDHSDVDASVVEHPSAPETTVGPAASEPEVEAPTPSSESVSPAQSQDETQDAVQDESAVAHVEEPSQATAPADVLAEENVEEPAAQQSEASSEQTFNESASKIADEVQEQAPAETQGAEKAVEPVSHNVEEAVTLPYTQVSPTLETKEEEIRPFTDFIEQFRQAEAARLQATLRESQIEAFSLLASTDVDIIDVAAPALSVSHTQEEPSETALPSEEVSAQATETGQGEEIAQAEIAVPVEADHEPTLAQTAEAPVPVAATYPSEHEASQERIEATEFPTVAEVEQAEEVATTAEPSKPTVPAEAISPQAAQRPDEAPDAVVEEAKEASPVAPVIERAVSPLLRTAARLRPSRHTSKQHQREDAREAAVETAQAQPTPSEPAPVESPRPARRYRFDRPAATNGTTQTAHAPTVQRTEESRTVTPPPARVEVGPGSNEQAPETRSVASAAQPAEPQGQKQPAAQEPVTPPAAAPAPIEQGRRRTQKEQPAAPPVVELVQSDPEQTPQQEEIPPEDLPPLEYADLQKANPRRRRRHRSTTTGSNGTSVTATTSTPTPHVPQAPAPTTPLAPTPIAPVTPPRSTPVQPAQPAATTSTAPYSIVSGYTVNQMNQGNDLTGPFMAPEPSPARGSILTREGRPATRSEAAQRGTQGSSYPSPVRESGLSSASLMHFANIVSQAIQTQTDSMVAELRRVSQSPTNVSVSLPPFPSSERVGVFVDVANLLYSARTLRITVDFGKLLDFLRGNRRLVRAQAYCPTSPQAGEEQMFLQAVKGLGYRITTKNYKTFSSGAKKADLDLDLCMDVVRLVDGKAVDCIVLVSGDSDFMPMLDYCSDHGVRVEVAAFDEAMSATLRQSCDLFVNLSMLEEIRS